MTSGAENSRRAAEMSQPNEENAGSAWGTSDAGDAQIERDDGRVSQMGKHDEGERWRRVVEESMTEVSKRVEEGLTRLRQERLDCDQMIEEFEKQKFGKLHETEDVLFDVMLQHKERILDEWRAPLDLWEMLFESLSCSNCSLTVMILKIMT
jgi:hypothetical protein